MDSGLSDQDAARFNINQAEKSDLMEEILTELSVYFGMLYHLIEVFKGHEDFAEELSEFERFPTQTRLSVDTLSVVSLDPPLPVYLFSIISNLRDKSAKGYPIKKVCPHALLMPNWS